MSGFQKSVVDHTRALRIDAFIYGAFDAWPSSDASNVFVYAVSITWSFGPARYHLKSAVCDAACGAHEQTRQKSTRGAL